MILDEILQLAVNNNVSDIILKAGSVPRMRYSGRLLRISNAQELTNTTMYHVVSEILPKHLEQKFSDNGDVDFSYQVNGARFRVNLYKEQQRLGLAFRHIRSRIPTAKELLLPSAIGKFATHRRGLTLVTGATGSGKSTTIAFIVDLINQQRSHHIITVEDPIEFIFTEKNCTISQREIGVDTVSFPHALRAALRQDPDVIFVGELRDRETVETALKAAETGHLVLSTLHTSGAVDTMTRIMSYFEPNQHTNIKMILAGCFNGTISQRLIPGINNDLVAAFEVMIANQLVRDCILRKNDYQEISQAIEEGKDRYGMISFDSSIFRLYQQKRISREVALSEATSPTNLELKMRGVG